MWEKIKKIFTDMFTETESDKISNMRVVSFIVALAPIITWVVYVFTKGWVDFGDSLAFLVLSALGSKAAQKWAERK